MMADSYDAGAIRPVQWGEVSKSSSGWTTAWDLVLESIDDRAIVDVESSGKDVGAGFEPKLTVADDSLTIRVETARWGMELDYYALTYRLFEAIDARIGRIRTIQGSPRDWWQPFREQ